MAGTGWARLGANWGSCGTPAATLKVTGAGAEGLRDNFLNNAFLEDVGESHTHTHTHTHTHKSQDEGEDAQDGRPGDLGVTEVKKLQYYSCARPSLARWCSCHC